MAIVEWLLLQALSERPGWMACNTFKKLSKQLGTCMYVLPSVTVALSVMHVLT